LFLNILFFKLTHLWSSSVMALPAGFEPATLRF
jgi:hypothetical protein